MLQKFLGCRIITWKKTKFLTFDFTTLYMTIPHNLLIKGLSGEAMTSLLDN